MAVGDRTETRLIGPAVITSANTTLGTVAASRVWVVKQIIFVNTNAVDDAITLAIGTSATAANCLFYRLPIAAYDTIVFDTAFTLAAAETIQAQTTRGGVNLVANGWLKEV